MCGIAGIIDWKQTPNQSTIIAMADALIHRGPDSGDTKIFKHCALGHRRLSIIDVTTSSAQPMTDISQRYWITFNGEIYNFPELKQELQDKGIQFFSDGDTEVLLQAWKLWGADCLEKLVGMFAFAIWDNEQQELFLARDRLGEKPLFYAPTPNGLIFASELKALLCHPGFKKEINPHAISQFLSLNYVLSSDVIYKNTSKLAPGHFLHYKKQQPPQIFCYWDLAKKFKEKSTASLDANIGTLQALLQQSLKGQMISDVALGAFLSGGVDSSTVVLGMSKLHQANLLQTFSIGFNEKSYSELPQSRAVAKIIGVDHHTKIVTADFAHDLENIVYHMDEPFADSSMIPTYYLSKFARENVTVSLTGDGGDELFLGYETHVADIIHNKLRHIPHPLINILNYMTKYIPSSFNKVSLDYKIKQFARGLTLPFPQAHYSWRTIFSEDEKQQLLSQPTAYDPYNDYSKFYTDVAGCHYLDQASYVDIKTWLVDDILVKVDRAAMAHSLETRCPFLDHRMVEFAASLPVNMKIHNRNTKYIVKKSLEKKLPHDIIYQNKKGFSAPVSHWLAGDIQTMARDVTNSQALKDWVNPQFVNKLWQEHTRKERDNGLKLFGLTCLGLWLKKYK